MAIIILRLPIYVFVPWGEFGFGASQCSICLTDFVDGERLRILPYGYIRHRRCLRDLVSLGRAACPECRRTFGIMTHMRSIGVVCYHFIIHKQ